MVARGINPPMAPARVSLIEALLLAGRAGRLVELAVWQARNRRVEPI